MRLTGIHQRPNKGKGGKVSALLPLILLLMLARSTSPMLTIWFVNNEAVTSGVANGILRVFKRDSS